jgi:hypothetical protein
MTSFRQIAANRRNAQLSTGPRTHDGKSRSRRNATRHGLTAETVIDALEDADDYAAFELAVTSDYGARTTAERELVLRLANLLWRLRRATAIETGLFKIQAEHLLQFRHRSQTQGPAKPTDKICRFALVPENSDHQNNNPSTGCEDLSPSKLDRDVHPDDLTRSFVRLSNLPTFPLDRLSRYEATLWRQACQILFTLRCFDQRRL